MASKLRIDRESAAQFFNAGADAGFNLPIAFVAGFSWPVEALPEPLQWLRWLLPSTSGVQASLRLNQLGAPLQAALPYLCGLVVLGAVCTAAVLFATRPRNVIAKAV